VSNSDIWRKAHTWYERCVEIELGLITSIAETWNTCDYWRSFPADDLCPPPLRWSNLILSPYPSHAETTTYYAYSCWVFRNTL